MEDRRAPHLIKNWISSAGLVIAGVSAFIILFFLVLSFVSNRINPYIGIVIVSCAARIPVRGPAAGPCRHVPRMAQPAANGHGHLPEMALRRPEQSRASAGRALFSCIAAVLFSLFSAVGIYQAYHYTESVEFCGLTCHKVMKPEYTAYQASPHARVRCVNCHIGPGAGWYAKSKLSGLYQVYAVLANVYPRPIPTPIENLRPAQETCETCHWPRAFFGSKQRLFSHFRYDKDNSPWPINMLVKIGGGSPQTSVTAGHPLAHEHRREGRIYRPGQPKAGHSLGQGHGQGNGPGHRVPGQRKTSYPGGNLPLPAFGSWTAWIAITARATHTSRRISRSTSPFPPAGSTAPCPGSRRTAVEAMNRDYSSEAGRACWASPERSTIFTA